VLQSCAVVVTNDSGLLHVAEAVGRPVVALFGPTAPQFGYAPYRAQSRLLQQPPACSPCSKNGSRPCSRPTHECMDNLTVDAVYAAVDAVLHSEPTSAGA
jgi:ADP-heptose:LPS heptosyltransferase